MLIIPNQYKATTKEVPSGSVSLKCKSCGTVFHVPSEKLTELGASPDVICETCSSSNDTSAKLNAVAEMSSEKNDEANKAIESALGK